MRSLNAENCIIQVKSLATATAAATGTVAMYFVS